MSRSTAAFAATATAFAPAPMIASVPLTVPPPIARERGDARRRMMRQPQPHLRRSA